MLRNGFVGDEVLDQLDDLEALAGSELEKGAQQAETLDRTVRRCAELEVQFSREIEVFHLAPMTGFGPFGGGRRRADRGPDAVTEDHGDDELWIGAPHRLARWSYTPERTRPDPRGCNYGKEQPFEQAQP